MNKGLGFRDSEASIVVESAIAWVLCLLRLLGAHALCYFSHNKDLSESFFEFCLRAYRYYAYYVPAEVMLSVISLLSFSRHICWIHKQREGLVKKGFFIILPLSIAGLYSVYWLLVMYPNIIDKQYGILYNLNKATIQRHREHRVEHNEEHSP